MNQYILESTSCKGEASKESESCQFGDCKECNNLCSLEELIAQTESSPTLLKAWYVDYFRWEEQEYDKGKQRLRKVVKNNSLYTVLKTLLAGWPAFRDHRLIKVKQDQEFNRLQDQRDPSRLLLQFDFSENAEITEQDEIQSESDC